MADPENDNTLGVDIDTFWLDPNDPDAVPDLDPMFGQVSGFSAVTQAAARAIEPILRDAIEDDLDPDGLERLSGLLETAVELDERVFSASVSIEFDLESEETRVEVDLETAEGPFQFVGALSADLIFRIVNEA